MARKVNIQLPKALLDFPEADRADVLATLREALALPEVKHLPRSQAPEHNMWEPNFDDLLAEAEDALYLACVSAEAEQLAALMDGLGLPVLEASEVQKAFSDDFFVWEDHYLEKAKGKGGKISELVNRSRAQRKRFIDWIKQKYALTKEQLSQVDKTLSQGAPDYAKKAEEVSVRASFIGKIRNQAEREHFETFGAYLDRVPTSLEQATKEGVVLTLREKTRTEARKPATSMPKTVTVLPLTPREATSAAYANVSAADKLTEVSHKHRAQIRQLIVQANKERWSSAELAAKLYDKFGEHNRDWRRVAITELSFAVNDAYLAGLEPGERVIGMGSVDACKHCKAYVIGKEFTVTHTLPKKDTYDTDMKQVWPGKTNYGRRVAEYRACIPMHPNCRCRWHRISRFYEVDTSGTLQRKTTAQLIQEERAKRGMAPDPQIEAKLADIRAQLGGT